MSCTLPPEILDLIIDHLHDEPATLKICCVVSKPWVPRARKHLFADIELHASQSHLELWKKTFPDPPNSPAHHTHTLSVCGAPALTAAEAEAGGWIRAFRNIKHLRLERLDLFPLTPFYGLSPAVRSLRLTHTTAGVLDLICSFPLLEDLALTLLSPKSSPDGWSTPSTSPKLTGYLELRTPGMVRSVTRRLSGLPGGLHFSKIKVVFFNDEVESVKDLVSRCSNTMESLTVICYPRSPFPSALVTDQYLTPARGRRFILDTPHRPLKSQKSQTPEVSGGKPECSVDHQDTPNHRIQNP